VGRAVLTYVDLFFPSGGPYASGIAKSLRDRLGLSFIQGAHDLSFQWRSPEEFADWVERLHGALRGTGALYRLVSVQEEEHPVAFEGWPPMLVPATPSGP
jgi:hypothetical protein